MAYKVYRLNESGEKEYLDDHGWFEGHPLHRPDNKIMVMAKRKQAQDIVQKYHKYHGRASVEFDIFIEKV